MYNITVREQVVCLLDTDLKLEIADFASFQTQNKQFSSLVQD